MENGDVVQALQTGRWLLLVAAVGTVGCEAPAQWESAVLTEESRDDSECVAEVDRAVQTVIDGSGLTDVEMDDGDLEEFVFEGQVDQAVTLYGGDEIRHWTFARFEEGPGCSVYNHGVTGIDLMTGEHDEAAEAREIRGEDGVSAREELERCRCQRRR